jgi:CubicO group peptidase (beta-lactamase class C family)
MKSNKVSITVIFLVVLSFTSGCFKDDELNLPYISYEPKNINDGLIISSPINEQVDSQLLNEIYAEVYNDENLWSLRSLLVFRNGKLISESYLKDEKDISNRHIVWSCTKQVVGVLVGIAIDKGIINNIDDPISAYFDSELNNHQDKADITIRNLLTMKSGIDYNNGEQSDELLQQIPDNSLDFVLNRPMNSSPGTVFNYNDGNPQLISSLIQKVTTIPADEYAEEYLFSKIEMTNYNWVRYKDGVTLGGFGIETTPRELAKVALCVADSGRWKGEQIIPSSWVLEMTSVQSQIENYDYSFGFLWWIDEARDTYFMWGAGGQFAFVVPSKNLVIVMTSFPNTAGEYEVQADEALRIVDQIIDASN